MEQKIDHVVQWLQDQVKASCTKGIVVGLSGGIDSSVVAFLIKKAFPNDSLGVILPCKSHSKDAEDAYELAEAVGIKHFEINLSDAHHDLLKGIEGAFDGEAHDNDRMMDANLRARLRMTTLYGVANKLGYLVAGTDNAAEILTGYFTKYGDGGVDILPIANLTKGEVYDWARHLGVPASVIERPPSAGLWEGQTDESEMGTTYNMIDAYLRGETVPEKDKAIIEGLNRRSEHKRNMPPAPDWPF
ncbi:MAG: NAD(+) synthase [Clostridia bacterium]|nr:NAD(+) synthase [Clostridia bacterium]